MSEAHITNLAQSRDHAAFEALVPALGDPTRQPLNAFLAERVDSEPLRSSAVGLHPVFALAKHFRSHDEGASGYTGNPHRGDHISIPAYDEFGANVAVIEISFHKGDTTIEVVRFPRAEPAIAEAAQTFLGAFETR